MADLLEGDEILLDPIRQEYRVDHSHHATAEFKALRVDVEDDNLRPRQLGELERGEPDGTGADDQARFVGLQRHAIDRMAADRQRLHKGQLLEGQFARNMEFARRHDEKRPKPAVTVDAERLMLLAAIRVTAYTGVALLAIDVRFH